MDRFEAKIVRVPIAGCHLWTGELDIGGYGRFRVESKRVKAHRVAWSRINGPIPKGMQILHSCDVRSCVNPDHLSLGSQQDNEDDKVSKMRQSRKLSPEQVLAIRADKRSSRVIGVQYGVSSMTVCDIKRRKYWAHLPN